jgi:hypothetical protein
MYLGLAAAGGLGYYMWRAGGNPQVAKKEMESEFLVDVVVDSICVVC